MVVEARGLRGPIAWYQLRCALLVVLYKEWAAKAAGDCFHTSPNARMKNGIFIASIDNLTLDQDVPEYFELLPGIRVSNSQKIRRRLLTGELYIAIGSMEFEHLQRTPAFIYFEYPPVTMEVKLDPTNYLVVKLIWLDWLFQTAWIIKDHAMRCEAAFLKTDTRPGSPRYDRNFLAYRPLDSRQTDASVVFTHDDLVHWHDLHHRIKTYFHQADSSEMRFFMEKDYSRSARALHYVRAARTSQNLAFRISHYCSALESLFSTTTSELSHRLSERVAFYLGEFGRNRREVYANVKKAYEVRSSLTHGGTLRPQKISELHDISQTCDSYLRQIFSSVFTSDMRVTELFDVEAAKIDAYFNDLILR